MLPQRQQVRRSTDDGMKGRERRMQDEAYWASLFDLEGILDRLLIARGDCYNVVEFGCGYGIQSSSSKAHARQHGQCTGHRTRDG